MARKSKKEIESSVPSEPLVPVIPAVSVLPMDGDSSEEDEPTDASIPTNQINNVSNIPAKPAVILFKGVGDDMEAEEEDEPISDGVSMQNNENQKTLLEESIPTVLASEEFTEALQVVTNNPWDVDMWKVFLNEVKNGRFGSSDNFSSLYKSFFQYYPRAYRVWNDYLNQCLSFNLFEEAEEIFSKIISKCRDVTVWLSYVYYMRTIKYPVTTTIMEGRTSKSIEDYNAERKAIELVYEQAVESIGYSFDSYPLWQSYIDFIRNWPETGIYADVGRKLNTLRKTYQRIVSIPMDNLDQFWREYESLEKQAGEHLAEKVLPEYNEKYLHARTIFNERRKFTYSIDFYRLATPPIGTLEEIQQLDLWNKWIKFELSNPDNLSAANLKTNLKMIYEQALNYFTHHAELWISLATLEYDATSLNETRAIYREAIEIVPKMAFLRLSFAECEEKAANFESCKEILRQMFIQIPCGFTFAAYQRFIRRREGILGARKCFSETFTMRQQDKILGFEIIVANAQSELDTNADATTALKVLKLANACEPVGIPDMRFVHLQVRALLRLGQLNEIQWIMNTLISDLSQLVAAYYQTSTFGTSYTGSSISTTSIATGADVGENRLPPNFDLLKALRILMYLWDELLHAESIMGLSDINYIIAVRGNRDKAKAEYEEYVLVQSKKSITSEDLNEKYRGTGIFQSSFELSERYDLLGTYLPTSFGDGDILFKERAKGKMLLNILQRQDIERQLLRRDGMKTNVSGGKEAVSELIGIPYILREFLIQLPPHTSSLLPDVDTSIRQLNQIIMPPRPMTDEGGDSKRQKGADGNVVSDSINNAVPHSDWITEAANIDKENDELLIQSNPLADTIRSDDIFRQRQRARLLL